MYISLPSRLISSVGRTDLMARLRRIATDSGFSSGSQVSSWKPRKISSMCLPCASSKRQPVSSSATGFRYSMIRCCVGGDHAVADRLQRDLRALLFLEERVLVELALGDVELDADQAAQPARRRRRAPWRGSRPSASRPCSGACGARSRTSASCRRCGRGSSPARAPCRPGARGAASPATRSGRARRSRASCASAARSRRCCSRRRSPTGRRWRWAARARCAPRAARGGAATRSRSRPVAKLAPTSFSSRCRFASQPSRGCDEHSAMKPHTRPFSDKPQTSSERTPSSAKRAASTARSRRGASVSRSLDDAQVLELAGEVRHPLEQVALHHLRIERREQAGGARHPLDRGLVRR